MKSYVQDSVSAEGERLRASDHARAVTTAIRRFMLCREPDEYEEEFRGRVPSIARGMAAAGNEYARRLMADLAEEVGR